MGRDEEEVSVGPLAGLRIIELAGIGPGPMCAMLLADLGADVLRIDRPQPTERGIKRPLKYDLLLRSRTTIALDLKKPAAVETALDLIERADALIEGYRPGVTERLGLGPDVCLARNPRLIYGRMTGWGQSGPLAHTAGHDLGYIAITGVLNAIGRKDQGPSVPLNLIGDYGGGSLYLALGILAGIIEARTSGKGQVVDAAIVDGAASLATTFFGMHAAGMLSPQRGTNMTDSGSHFYDVYECADGKWLAVGPIESKFYAQLLQILDIDPADLGPQQDAAGWPQRQGTAGRKAQDEEPRRMGCAFRADRRLRSPGPRLVGGAAAPAAQGSRHICRSRRSRATFTRATFQPHTTEGPTTAERDRPAPH